MENKKKVKETKIQKMDREITELKKIKEIEQLKMEIEGMKMSTVERKQKLDGKRTIDYEFEFIKFAKGFLLGMTNPMTLVVGCIAYGVGSLEIALAAIGVVGLFMGVKKLSIIER